MLRIFGSALSSPQHSSIAPCWSTTFLSVVNRIPSYFSKNIICFVSQLKQYLNQWRSITKVLEAFYCINNDWCAGYTSTNHMESHDKAGVGLHALNFSVAVYHSEFLNVNLCFYSGNSYLEFLFVGSIRQIELKLNLMHTRTHGCKVSFVKPIIIPLTLNQSKCLSQIADVHWNNCSLLSDLRVFYPVKAIILLVTLMFFLINWKYKLSKSTLWL